MYRHSITLRHTILGNIHKYAKDKYSQRFPELETLVIQPLNYLKVMYLRITRY